MVSCENPTGGSSGVTFNAKWHGFFSANWHSQGDPDHRNAVEFRPVSTASASCCSMSASSVSLLFHYPEVDRSRVVE